MEVDYKQLLIKYMAKIVAAEGLYYATTDYLSPYDKEKLDYTEEEKHALEEIILTVTKLDEDGKIS